MNDVVYLGLMSGTSIDGLDLCAADFDSKGCLSLRAFNCVAYPESIKAKLEQAVNLDSNDLDFLSSLDRELAYFYAASVKDFLNQQNIAANSVKAVGCIGQTVRHNPNLKFNFSCQIVDPSTLASATGINVIADFRRKDIAVGGQGAPLAPVFHSYLVKQAAATKDQDIFVINIGGIANISCVNNEGVIGFDCGPGNALLDAWVKKHWQVNYDQDAKLASQGQVSAELLRAMYSDSFFKQKPPKSTGKELFNLAWLTQKLAAVSATVTPKDVQATLNQLTIQAIVDAVKALSKQGKIYVCGGGAFNPLIIAGLQKELTRFDVATTIDGFGIAPEAVEAAMVAWFAYMYDSDKFLDLTAITGASRPCRLGVKYLAY